MNSSSSQADPLAEVRTLVHALCDERLEGDECVRLEEVLLANSDARLLYLEMVQLHAALHHRAGSLGGQFQLEASEALDVASLSDAMILPAFQIVEQAENSETGVADRLELASGESLQPPAEKTRFLSQLDAASVDAKPGRWRRIGTRGALWLVMAAAVVLAVSLALIRHSISANGAATVLASSDARFDAASDTRSSGESVAPGKTYNLARGLLELKFGGGADVLIEAPAVFAATSRGSMSLSSGRISVTAAGAAHGFVVQTPQAQVTDLGTQFGVLVDLSGATQVQVFEGRVAVAQKNQLLESALPDDAPATLFAGDSASIAGHGVTVSAGGAAPQAFVRSLAGCSSIDMVDLICGGDGTSHRHDGAIDPRTGASGQLDPIGTVDSSDTGYHRVKDMPVIDGCFVPNGNMTVDSAGHTFDFGVTGATSFYQIRAGGTFAWPNASEKFAPVLGNIDYSQPGHGLFLLHPNGGITFDLAVLRRLHPGLKMNRFDAFVGNVHASEESGAPARVMVLVDGQSRLERDGLQESDPPVRLDVPVNESDRFLTIVSTDDGTNSYHDWIIFGDPRLE